MNILVVDDDPISREMIETIIEGMDYSVLLAEDALEALSIIDTNPSIDLIISDMNMPMVSGIELFQNLVDADINLPFILLTGDDPTPLLAQAPNMSACLIKDFSMVETLPPLIEQVIQARGN